MKALKGWIKDILIAVIIAMLIMTFLKPTIVKENSMQPTLNPNNYIFLSKQAYTLFSQPKAGDIIVFHTELTTSDGKEKLLIKRIVALPGDVVTIAEGKVYVNDILRVEPYIHEGGTPGYLEGYTVPEGEVFVMGDNRAVSIDSRDSRVGCVPIDEIVGKAFFRLYPFDSIGLL